MRSGVTTEEGGVPIDFETVNGVPPKEGQIIDVGAAAYNQQLSDQRAATVVKFLQSQGALRAGFTFQGVGFGNTRPTDSNDTDQGRARNRRVEIRVTESRSRP